MRDPSTDLLAEEGLLGLALFFPDKCKESLLSVAPTDWYHPKHKQLAAVITGMYRNGQSIDALTTFSQCQAQGLASRLDAAWIFGLTQKACRAESAPDIAARLRELSGRRKLYEGAQRLSQRLEQVDENDSELTVSAAITEMRQYCNDAEQVAAERSRPMPQRMDAFLDVEDTFDWLVPGMLERMERIILTGAEGGGKSVLCSQLAGCMAGGVHPFTAQVMDASVRVLIIDCENSAAQSRRRYRGIVQKVNAIRQDREVDPVSWGDQMFIDMRPAGIDLLDSKDVGWLEYAVSSTAPDLLVLGPLYKLHHENPNDETAARELTWVLDGLRERHGFALLTEAHAGNATDQLGKRNMRPIGSSLFRRWSEYGFGLSRSDDAPDKPRAEKVDVVSWRGSREERLWPSKLHYGTVLPWQPADSEYYDEVARSKFN